MARLGTSTIRRSTLLKLSGRDAFRDIEGVIVDLERSGFLTKEGKTWSIPPGMEAVMAGERHSEPDCTPKTAPREREISAEVAEVFEHWASKLSSRKKPRLGNARKRKISARLKDGFSVGELKLAIDGVASDDFLVKNGYTSIEMIFRHEDNVEKYMSKAPQKRDEAMKKDPSDYWPPIHGEAKERENKYFWNEYIAAGVDRDAWVAKYPTRQSWFDEQKRLGAS